MTNSSRAKIPAIIVVMDPKPHKIQRRSNLANKKFIWIKRYIPAINKVEEWTNDETGVGAAIAADSQAENGI
jgi:hypothetical protein